MTTSVVMSIYNGEKFIIEQLESLKNQTCPIDEVLIYDDCSIDNTYDITSQYIIDNKLSWRLQKNNKNLGWEKTFVKGMTEASCDLIFPCDQDDIWHLDKIKHMSGVMEDNPDIYVLSGQSHRYYEDERKAPSLRVALSEKLNAISYRRLECKNTKHVNKVIFGIDFMKCQPGCVLCVRKDFFESIKEEWFEKMPHDKLLVFYSKLLDHYYELDYEVIDQRMHHDSASHSETRTRKGRSKQIVMEKKLIEGMIRFAEQKQIKQEYKNVLKGGDSWITDRYKLVVNRKLRYAIPLMRYFKYYTQHRRFFTDCLYSLR